MQKAMTELPQLWLVGIQARTNNGRESNPETALIGSTLYRYVEEKVAQKIRNRVNPGVTFCIYTEYESDYKGDYTYFVGEAVHSIKDLSEGLNTLCIPSQKYVLYTTEAGPMPAVVIKAWHHIWDMTPQEMGAERRYCADFEVYDARASDPQSTIVDVYIGVNP